MSFQIPVVLLALHFVADFILQSDWMAQSKSKRWDALSAHVFCYAAFVAAGMNWAFFFGGIVLPFTTPLAWFLWTFATHFVTDAITSRINSWNWNAKRVHWFFVGVGADQLIHAATLATTWNYLKP